MSITRLADEIPAPSSPSGTTTVVGGREQPAAGRWLFGALALLLGAAALSEIFAPASLGALLTVATGAILLLAAGLAAGRTPPALPLTPLAPSFALVTLVAAWILLQATSLIGWHHPLWQLAADALAGAGAARATSAISLDPSAGTSAVLALLRDAAVLFLAFQLAATSRRARQVLLAVVIVGAVYASAMLSAALLPGPRPLVSGALPAVAGLCLLGVFALLVMAVGRPASPPTPGSRPALATLHRLIVSPWWGAFGIAVLAAGLVVVKPLSDFLSFLLGMLGFLLAIAVAPSLAHLRRRLGFAVAIAVVTGALVIGLSAALARMNAADTRSATIHGLAAQAIADAPLLGTGANTFESTAHLYGADLDTARTSPGALLEAMVELGVPATLALVLACAGLFICCAHGVSERRRNAIYPCLGIGATLLVACDASTNVSLQNPFVATVWCVIMGIACAQSLPGADRRSLTAPAARG
jgi:hypothetical protein